MKKPLLLLIASVVFASCVSMQGRLPGTGSGVSVEEPARKKERPSETGVSKEAEQQGEISLDVLIYKASNPFTVLSDKEIKASMPGIAPVNEMRISLEGGEVSVNGTPTGMRSVRFSSQGMLSINKKKFRGEMTVKIEGSRMLLINNVTLDKYLYGVLPSEIAPSWDMESLKAQAVAARSFALYKRLNNKNPLYDLDSTVISQVYNGYNIENARTNSAVDETEGRVMTYNNKVIEAFFHANSGGRTEEAKYVWGGDLPYLKSVNDPYCSDGKHYKWELRMGSAEIKARLDAKGVRVGELYDIKPQDRSQSGRIVTMKVYGSSGSAVVKGNDFRNNIGVDKLRSTNFEVNRQGNEFVFEGKGWGHGVGMSQEGAKGLAEHGRGYKDILRHYYPGVEIKKMVVK